MQTAQGLEYGNRTDLGVVECDTQESSKDRLQRLGGWWEWWTVVADRHQDKVKQWDKERDQEWVEDWRGTGNRSRQATTDTLSALIPCTTASQALASAGTARTLTICRKETGPALMAKTVE